MNMKPTLKYYILVALAVVAMLMVTIIVAVPKLVLASHMLTELLLATIVGTIIICTGIIVSKIEDIKNK